MNNTILFIISFILCFILLFFGIKYLRRRNIGQAIRQLGPKTHRVKSGTPNIGGVIIIISALLIYTISWFYDDNIEVNVLFMLVMPLISYGLLGFVDDFIKAKTKKNDGLSASSKLFFQICWAVLYFFIFLDYENTSIYIFGKTIDLKWFYGVFILLSFVSTSNAFNLCDGLDGLAGGLSIIILTSFLFISNNEMINNLIICLVGAIFAFVVFNFYPAKIFMGDSGSLAIGAFIANICIICKIEMLLLVFGLVMIIETLSVIIQVGYYKLTKGKRVFLMTPLHHHYELKGYKESKITIVFWFIQIIFVIIGICLYVNYYRR